MKFCTTFKVGEDEYQARLTAKACVELEKTLGENPLNVFTSLSQFYFYIIIDVKILIFLHNTSF